MSRFATVIKAVATFAFMQGSANMGFQHSQEVEVVKSVQGVSLSKRITSNQFKDTQSNTQNSTSACPCSCCDKFAEFTKATALGFGTANLAKEGCDAWVHIIKTPGMGACGHDICVYKYGIAMGVFAIILGVMTYNSAMKAYERDW